MSGEEWALEASELPMAWHLAAVRARDEGRVTYITERGVRIAAVVPLRIAMTVEALARVREVTP